MLPSVERYDANQKIRHVRLVQVGLITAGVIGAIAPLLLRHPGLVDGALVLGIASLLLGPVGYVAFTLTVESAMKAFVPEGAPSRSRLLFAFLTLTPCAGPVFEIVLLHQLAKETARLEGARDRSALVVLLALVRTGAVWFGALVVGPLVVGGEAVLYAVYCFGPILSLALLGVITQLIATPLLDQLMPEARAVRLGGAGGSSSMAVPSSSSAPAGSDRS